MHFIKDIVQKKIVKVNYIQSEQNIADALTKPLPKLKFKKFIDFLNLEQE